MSKQLQNIDPVEYTYTVKNVYDGNPVYFHDLGAARDFILEQVKTNWTRVWLDAGTVSIYDLISCDGIRHRHHWHSGDGIMERLERKYKWRPSRSEVTFTEGSYPFLVTNQYGAIISAKEVASAPKNVRPAIKFRTKGTSRFDRIDRQYMARLTNRKNSAKIKDFHRTVMETKSYPYGTNEEEVTSAYWWWCRSPKTYNELRQSNGHDTEEHEDFGKMKFSRARRGYRHLPQWWSDKPVAARRAAASWKTNSKRRKQYKGE